MVMCKKPSNSFIQDDSWRKNLRTAMLSAAAIPSKDDSPDPAAALDHGWHGADIDIASGFHFAIAECHVFCVMSPWMTQSSCIPRNAFWGITLVPSKSGIPKDTARLCAIRISYSMAMDWTGIWWCSLRRCKPRVQPAKPPLKSSSQWIRSEPTLWSTGITMVSSQSRKIAESLGKTSCTPHKKYFPFASGFVNLASHKIEILSRSMSLLYATHCDKICDVLHPSGTNCMASKFPEPIWGKILHKNRWPFDDLTTRGSHQIVLPK